MLGLQPVALQLTEGMDWGRMGCHFFKTPSEAGI